MNYAICDDERFLRKAISAKIKRSFPHASITEFSSGEALVASTMGFDVIFLDIGMSGIDGIRTAEQLRENGSTAEIIFITAFEDRVFEAFDVRAFNFLVKPVSDERFDEVLQKAVQSHLSRIEQAPEQPCITVKYRRTSTRIALSDIIYAEVFDRKLTLHTTNGNYEYYGKLSELENRMVDGFFRTHRAFLINLRYLESYTSTEVIMETGDRILLAKQRYPALVKAYMHYIKEE